MERKAQQQRLKNTILASASASACIRLFFTPMLRVMESNTAAAAVVMRQSIDGMIGAWQEVRQICDVDLHRERAEYAVRSGRILSPLLGEFEHRLIIIRDSYSSDTGLQIHSLKAACVEIIDDLIAFDEWVRTVAPTIRFNTQANETKARQKASRYWGAAARGAGVPR
jgi:hypothetical protein